MKKIIVSILFFCNAFSIFSQEKFNPELKINYNIYYNTEIPNTKKGVLYIDNTFNRSLFTFGRSKEREVKSTSDKILQIKFSESERFNFYKASLDSMYSKEKIIRNEFIIAEKAIQLNWILSSETKKIDTLEVKKATLKYRGRNYIAWYSKDLPLKYGPWKFNNLPGLILEIYDETYRYRWVIRSIVKLKKKEKIDIDNLLLSAKKVTIKDFVDMRYNLGINILNESRLPRGTTANRQKIKRNGIELIFEWEEEKE